MNRSDPDREGPLMATDVVTSPYKQMSAETIVVGDMLRVMGEDHLITAVEPYIGTLFTPDQARRACSGADWSITLINGQPFEVIRRG